jgi:hypothetical protein
VKKAKFFEGINWKALERRELPGPVKPRIAGGLTDVENFAAGEQFNFLNILPLQ